MLTWLQIRFPIKPLPVVSYVITYGIKPHPPKRIACDPT